MGRQSRLRHVKRELRSLVAEENVTPYAALSAYRVAKGRTPLEPLQLEAPRPEREPVKQEEKPEERGVVVLEQFPDDTE